MNKRFIATLLTLPLALSSAFAQDTSAAPTVKISGFGTGALTWADTDQAEFARPNQASGVRKSPGAGVDSNLGLQADFGINHWMSVTLQGLVRKDAEDDFGAEISLGFVKAKLSDKLALRVGRMGAPMFMISDYRNVGYANTFLRPPVEVYAQVTTNNIDGIDAIWQQNFGDTTITAQLALGQSHAKVPSSAGGITFVDFKNMVALNLVAEHGPLTVRLGRTDGKLTIDSSATLNGLFGGLRATAAGYQMPQLATLADQLAVDKKKASFTSAGLGLDWNNVVAQAEYAVRKTDSFINDTTSWYVMGGYRIGKLLPYYLHSSTRSDHHVANTVPAACPAGYPAACTATLHALSAGIDAVGAPVNQSSNSIGVRWDLYRSMALKVQLDRFKPSGNAGLFLHPSPGFTGPVTTAAVALDFVF